MTQKYFYIDRKSKSISELKAKSYSNLIINLFYFGIANSQEY